MLKSLNDTQLLLEIKNLVKEEKKITQEILDYLAEVEHRRLYALRGYDSLFTFCVEELGYSESSAFRRISAMRVIKTIPEAKVKLEEGSVNLSTLSQLHSFIKKEEKLKKIKIDPEDKADLLSKIENKSQRECEREFVKISPEIIKTSETQRPVTEDLTEIKFMASKELMGRLNKLKNLLGHKNIQGMAELIDAITHLALKKVEPKMKEANQSTSAAEVRNDTISVSMIVASSAKSSRYVSKKIKSHVWSRDRGECQYVDPLTQKKCSSRTKLEYDHRIPLAKGGNTSEENLRLLCSTHNQLEGIHHFSRKHMAQFIPSLKGC